VVAAATTVHPAADANASNSSLIANFWPSYETSHYAMIRQSGEPYSRRSSQVINKLKIC
jgi:hypothetical protein